MIKTRLLTLALLATLLPAAAEAQQVVQGRNYILKIDGTAARPSGSFERDTDTGDYRESENVWALATGGVKRLSVSTTAVTSSLPILFATDNTYDIGAGGANRPRYIYAATSVYASFFRSPSYWGIYNTGVDGVIQLTNNAGNGFTRLILGTNDASGLALKKNGVNLDVVTGNDGAFSAVRALGFTATSSGYGGPSTTGTLITNDAQTVAVAGTVNVGTSATIGLFVVAIAEDNDSCLFALRGSGVPTEISDPSGICSNTAGTATSVNVYWDGAANYKVQNNRAASRSIRIIRLGV